MPRTATEEWTDTEGSWEPVDESQSYRHWRELLRRKRLTAERFIRAKRTAIRQPRQTLQRGTWTCSYCQWHATSRGYIRRINIQVQFNQLANTWKQETGHLSNMTTRAMHPAYQRIIGMGKEAVPLMLDEFRRGELDVWFWAL